MSRPFTLTLLAIALTALPSLASCQQADPRIEVRVDELFAEIDRTDSPGAAVLVVQDGEVMYRKGFGQANLEHGIPITPSTVFDIASMSKQFAGMSIAVLAEQGRINLEDDVRTYLPDLPDFGQTVTLDHLVHHTSGIRDWPGTLAVAGWRMDDVISFEQILTMARNQQDLNFTPGADLFAQRLESDEAPVALATGDFFDAHAAVSPDGRWLAYASDESGRPEVYVHPFPNTGDARWQISSEGGAGPAWAHSGRELFYLSPDQQMMSVDVVPGSTFIAGDRRALFSVQPFFVSASTRYYDVAPDDDRFVMIRPAPDEGLGQIVVVENFFEEILRRMGN